MEENNEEPKFYRKKWFIAALILLLAGAGFAYYWFSGDEGPDYVLAEAVKGDIIQIVDVTGTIKAEPTIELHFQKSGKVNEINVEEGVKVEEGDLLASLENKSLELETERQSANLQYARAQYNQTKAGAKYEEILISQADLKSAEASLDAALVEQQKTKELNGQNINLARIAYKQAEQNKESAYNEYLNTKELAEKELAKLDIGGTNTKTIALENAYKTAQTQLDTIFTSMQDSLFLVEGIIGVRGSGYALFPQSDKTRLKNDYHEPAENEYENALAIYQALPSDPTNDEVDVAVDEALNAADEILLLVSQTGFELESLPYDRTDLDSLIVQVSNQSSSLSNSILNLRDTESNIKNITTGTVQDVETLRLTQELKIDAALNSYETAKNALSEAAHNLEQAKTNAEVANKNADAQVALKQAAVDSAEATLALKKSPARDVDLAPLLANITQAEIALKIAEKEYRDSQLFAPIEGIVTFIHGEVGENIALTETALKPFVSLQAENLIVEANVPETDIIKIEKGDEVDMTIDAFDFTESFSGEVVYIDPAETVVQGVIYYGIETAFTIDDERLKSGMTTNLEIVTDKKTDIIKIPIRALRYEDSKKYVEVLKNGRPEKVTVTTGLESDQYVEITSGLKEGDKIVTFIK